MALFSSFMKKNLQDEDLSITAKLVSGLPDNLTVEMNNDVDAFNKLLSQVQSYGSPGMVTGRVNVIRSTEDFAQLKRGEVLVAMTTNPAWTPLFSVAGALVTDYGGPLSHGGIVAREYSIPAVLGVGKGTDYLKNGQRITVDMKSRNCQD